jgi:hypothetical protein
MVHTNPEFETSNLILDFEFDQHLESRKHVINIIMWFKDMGCYNFPVPTIILLGILYLINAHTSDDQHKELQQQQH